MQDIYYLAILKFYSKLINNNLPHYFDDFMPHFSIGATNYNIRNPDLQLLRIRHEFPRSSLRYQLISTLNETSPEIMEMAKKCTQYIFINHDRKSIVDGYRDACENPDNCYSSYYNNNNRSVLLDLIHSYICIVCIILYFIAGM